MRVTSPPGVRSRRARSGRPWRGCRRAPPLGSTVGQALYGLQLLRGGRGNGFRFLRGGVGAPLGLFERLADPGRPFADALRQLRDLLPRARRAARRLRDAGQVLQPNRSSCAPRLRGRRGRARAAARPGRAPGASLVRTSRRCAPLGRSPPRACAPHRPPLRTHGHERRHGLLRSWR